MPGPHAALTEQFSSKASSKVLGAAEVKAAQSGPSAGTEGQFPPPTAVQEDTSLAAWLLIQNRAAAPRNPMHVRS